MPIIYKVAKKSNSKYLSSSTELFKHDYKKEYNGSFGLFGFKHPRDAELFYNILDVDNLVILKGQAKEFYPINYSINSLFTVAEHKAFWNLFHSLNEAPNPIEMMKHNLFPRELPGGSIIMFNWKFIEEIKNIDFEILQYERSKNANR